MKAKYTQGAWRIDRGYLVVDDSGHRIADCGSNVPRHPKEYEANAKLIAAAPYLLEASQLLLSRLDSITTDGFAKGGEREEREALRRAIVKATT